MANHIYILYNIYIYININIYLSIYTLLCKPSDYNEEFPLRSASSSLFSARSNVQGVRIELETSRLRDFEAQGSRESFGTARDCFGNGAGARTTCSRTSDTWFPCFSKLPFGLAEFGIDRRFELPFDIASKLLSVRKLFGHAEFGFRRIFRVPASLQRNKGNESRSWVTHIYRVSPDSFVFLAARWDRWSKSKCIEKTLRLLISIRAPREQGTRTDKKRIQDTLVTRRSFRTNSTTTDESLLACLLAEFLGVETGTRNTVTRPRFRCPSLSLASLSLEYDTKTYTGKEYEWCLDDLSPLEAGEIFSRRSTCQTLCVKSSERCSYYFRNLDQQNRPENIRLELLKCKILEQFLVIRNNKN